MSLYKFTYLEFRKNIYSQIQRYIEVSLGLHQAHKNLTYGMH